MMMFLSPTAAVLVLCTILLHEAAAYPWYWVDPGASGRLGDTPAGCLQHPNSREGPHRGVNPDPTIGISVLATDGSTVQSVCPGRSYTVQVSFGEEFRHCLITATYGHFSATLNNKAPELFYYPTTGSNMLKCPNRLLTQQVQQVKDTLRIPCDAAGSLEIKVTSAPGEVAFMQASQTLTLNTGCADSSCPAASVTAPAPTTTPATTPTTAPAPTPATTPTTTPVTAPTPATTPSTTPATTPTPATPTPASTPAPTPRGTTTTAVPNAANANTVQAANCDPSTLGYRCSRVVGATRVHYSLGGSMPQNPCTNGAVPNADTSGPNVLHMAVEAPVTGYVGLAFAQTANSMAPADAIVGWIDANNQPYVNTYYITGESLSDQNIKPWSAFKGVAKTGNNVVACFTRQLTDPNAVVSRTLDPNTAVTLNWAVSSTPGYGDHDDEGAATLNLQTGDVSQVASKKEQRIRWHGALMSAAWALMLPLGTLLPKHRWTMGPAKLFGEQMWFTLHVICQTVGFGLMVAGAVIAWMFFDEPEDGAKLGKAHQVLGTIVFAAASVQYLSAFARPAREHRLRPLFNYFHWWTGRISVLIAWATIYLGILLYHRSIYKPNLLPWLIPVAVSMGLLVLMDLALTITAISKRKPLGSSAPPPPAYYQYGNDGNGVAMSKLNVTDVPPGVFNAIVGRGE